MFLIVGLGMLWRTFVPDAPSEAGSRTFAVFQVLVVVLGTLVMFTQVPGM